jgi:serine/threonine protein kinase
MVASTYKRVSLLGEGAFGEVWLVERESKQFALKIVKKSDELLQTAIHNELAALKTLQGLSGISFLHDFEEDDTEYRFVLELCKGKNLWSLIEQNGAITEATAKSIFSSIARTLSQVHAKGIAHLDIKFENLLIEWDPTLPTDRVVKAKLIDFGLCQVYDKQKDSKDCTQFSGSPNFVAPEIFQRFPFCPFKADIYSLGVILFSMLTGTLPFTLEYRLYASHCGLSSNVEWPEVEISEEAKNLVESMLESDPDKRPSIAQILDHRWIAAYKDLELEPERFPREVRETKVSQQVKFPSTKTQDARLRSEVLENSIEISKKRRRVVVHEDHENLGWMNKIMTGKTFCECHSIFVDSRKMLGVFA